MENVNDTQVKCEISQNIAYYNRVTTDSDQGSDSLCPADDVTLHDVDDSDVEFINPYPVTLGRSTQAGERP